MTIIHLFQIDKPMMVEIREGVGRQAIYGNTGDWLLTFDDGSKMFVPDALMERVMG